MATIATGPRHMLQSARQVSQVIPAGALAALLLSLAAPAASGESPATALAAEQAEVTQRRAARLQSLTSDTGWLSLVGLLWLKDGENSFGSDDSNSLVLKNPSLAGYAGSFVLKDHTVQFIAGAAAGITHRVSPSHRSRWTRMRPGSPPWSPAAHCGSSSSSGPAGSCAGARPGQPAPPGLPRAGLFPRQHGVEHRRAL